MKTEYIELNHCDISIQNTIPTVDNFPARKTTIMVLSDIDVDCIKDGDLVIQLTEENATKIINGLSEAIAELKD